MRSTWSKKKRLALAASEGWPVWQMSGALAASNSVKTVGNLIGLLRHSVAHGHVTFNCDSRQLDEVTITFENKPSGTETNWRGSIRADMLACFCRKFSAFVADRVA